MNKQEFLARLEQALAGLPQEELAERLGFYGEMIDDRVEEGLTEEEAVAGLGPVEELAAQIVAETPITAIVREKVRSHPLRAWEILLLILGFPLWFPLLIAASAVLLSVFIVVWAVVLSLWAVVISLILSVIACLVGGVVLLFTGGAAQGLLLVSGALIVAGLSIFLFYGCKGLVKAAVKLMKATARGIKSLFLGKEKTK
ncbi:MAG: DUF1700 domain-containing protein [Oscillospiraceae bacterium]|nr:DUF1700 domain-containing protein [Oscillospiraceae bacterium]